MMNAFAISLVLTILITAGVVSPNDGNIKITISPQETEQKAKTEPEEVKDKIKENDGFYRLNARELVCDAFGKCKHKIASALEGTKHSVPEKIHEIEEDAKGAFHEVASKVHEASDKVKEKGKESVGKIVDEVKGKAKEVAETTDTLKGDVERNASEDLELIEDKVEKGTHRLRVEGKRGYEEIRRFFSHMSAYIFSSKSFRSFMGMIHLLGFALSYGVCFWVTFISSNILAKALPKQQFSVVQSKIYPVYFKTLSYGVAAAFLGHYLSQSRPYYENRTETIQGLIFLAIFSMTMFNSFYLEPRAAKVMRDRMKVEKEEGKGQDVFDIEPSTSSVDAFKDPTGIRTGQKTTGEPIETQQELPARVKPQVEILSQRLKKLNVMSSFLNVLTLIGLTYHLLHRSQLLHSNPY